MRRLLFTVGFFALISSIVLVVAANREYEILQSIASGIIAVGCFKAADFFVDEKKK